MNCARTLIAVAVVALAGVLPTRAAEVDRLLPDNTGAVVTVKVKQALESPLGKKHIAPLLQQALAKNSEAAQGFALLGFDPLKDFDSVTIATPTVATTDIKDEASKALVIVHGVFDPAKVHGVADNVLKNEPAKLALSKEGDVRLYEAKNPNGSVFLALLDKGTLVGSATKATVAAAVKGSATPKLSKEMTALVGKVDGKQTVWFAAIAPKVLKEKLAENPQTKDMADKIMAFGGGVTLDKDLSLGASVFTADAKTAEDLAAFAEAMKNFGAAALKGPDVAAQLGKDNAELASGTLDGIKINTTKDSTSLSMKVTEDAILKVMKLAQPK